MSETDWSTSSNSAASLAIYLSCRSINLNIKNHQVCICMPSCNGPFLQSEQCMTGINTFHVAGFSHSLAASASSHIFPHLQEYFHISICQLYLTSDQVHRL